MCFKGPIARHCSQCRILVREDPTYQSYCYSMVLTRQCHRQVTREPFEWTKVFKEASAECKAGSKGGSEVSNVKIEPEPVARPLEEISKPPVHAQALDSSEPCRNEKRYRSFSSERKGLSPIHAVCQFFAWDFGLIFAVIAVALLLSAGSASELA